jgi:hypothetical protein
VGYSITELDLSSRSEDNLGGFIPLLNASLAEVQPRSTPLTITTIHPFLDAPDGSVRRVHLAIDHEGEIGGFLSTSRDYSGSTEPSCASSCMWNRPLEEKGSGRS